MTAPLRRGGEAAPVLHRKSDLPVVRLCKRPYLYPVRDALQYQLRQYADAQPPLGHRHYRVVLPRGEPYFRVNAALLQQLRHFCLSAVLQQQKGQAVQLVYVYPLPLRKRVPARKHDLVLVVFQRQRVQPATTFTSQNHAAGMPDRCARVFRLCLLYFVLFSAVLIAPVVAFRRFFCSLFSTEPAVIQYACLRIMCILLYEPACCLYEIPAGCLRGAGHAVLPAAATLLGTCAFRIVWTCAVFPRQPSLALLVAAAGALSWLVTTALVALCFIIAAARRAAVPDMCA